MTRLIAFLSLVFIGVGPAVCSGAPPLASLQMFDESAFAFESYEALAWSEVLQNRLAAKPKVGIPGRLILPQNTTGRMPVVVIMHGSGGAGGRERGYARELLKEGIGAAILDSFAPRGLMHTGGQQERLSILTMVGDVYALLNLLSTHPRVDPDRVGLLGFSRGGSVTVYAADEQVRSALAVGKNRFAVGVAFYPACVAQLKRVRPAGTSLFMLLGEQDSYTPAAQCERYIERMKAAGFPVTTIKYEGAHHGFDSPGGVHFSNFDYSYGRCNAEVDEAGEAVDVDAGFPIRTQEDARMFIERCGTRGVWIGGNEVTARRSLADLKAILKRAFTP